MTKKIIGRGHVSNSLYILDTCVPRSIACASIISPFEAHYRLGHPYLPTLKKLCPQFHFSRMWVLSFCISLSPRINKQARYAFELDYLDIWGPCGSKIGLRYFVTFVDDFSWMIWIYFMKIVLRCSFTFVSFVLKLRLSLIFMYAYWGVIMLRNKC